MLPLLYYLAIYKSVYESSQMNLAFFGLLLVFVCKEMEDGIPLAFTVAEFQRALEEVFVNALDIVIFCNSVKRIILQFCF